MPAFFKFLVHTFREHFVLVAERLTFQARVEEVPHEELDMKSNEILLPVGHFDKVSDAFSSCLAFHFD